MTLLEIIQQVCKETGFTAAPDSVIGNSDLTVVQLLAFANKTAKAIGKKYPWRQLVKEHTFTLATSTPGYALPADFDYDFYETHWNRDEEWLIKGPLTQQEHQLVKSGNITSRPYQRFYIRGLTSAEFQIDPTPTSSENGQTCAYDYKSKSCCRPMTYATGTDWAAGSHCFYNGVIYSTVSGGTSNGATPVADVGVTWVVDSAAYDTFLKDTDLFVLDEDALILGIKAEFKKENGYEWKSFHEEYVDKVDQNFRRNISRGPIPTARTKKLPWPNVPQTGINNYGA